MISRESRFNSFVSLIKLIDHEIISTFPGIVRINVHKEDNSFTVYSKRFPFLIGKTLDFDFVTNDAPAFTYGHATEFFKEKINRNKTLLGLVIGTGINGAYMSYYDFKRLSFLKKTFEMGHITFQIDGERCFCGRKGCAELYTSGKYIERLGNGNISRVFSDETLRKRYYRNLATYLTSLVITISPDKIVFGGSVSKSLELPIIKDLLRENMPHHKIDLDIELERDTSVLSNIDGLKKLYRRFKKVRRVFI
ncbi:MAG TPA: ROK family protein [Thermoplasmatales archaeon]|nr:ROK family protein [Thermoplasmatales archaeon]